MDSYPKPGLVGTLRHWWRDTARLYGQGVAARRLVREVWDFLRDSTPSRRRQHYGDIDYDWDHRVNTTSAAVAWGDRLIGHFHSPYQPTDPDLFHEMMEAVERELVNPQGSRRNGRIRTPSEAVAHVIPSTGAGRADRGTDPRTSGLPDGQTHLGTSGRSPFSNFLFLDLGSGKGRTLLMASDYPFRRIVGVELLPALHHIAQENLQNYRNPTQQCFSIECVCADAADFVFPNEPTILYLFNPFPEAGLTKVIATIEQSLESYPRPFYVVYHNPELDNVLKQSRALKKTFSTHQYAIYTAEKEL